MFTNKIVTQVMVVMLLLAIAIPIPLTHAAALDNIVNTLSSSTISSTDGGASKGGLFENLFNLIFNKILGPILNIFSGKGTAPSNSSIKINPLPPADSKTGTIQDAGALRGKVIVVDPGHGGSNPGAVDNNVRESDNNLAVGLKLRDKLVQAGAKVIMTRDKDTTVASEGSSLGDELQARVDIAESNNADMFISVHSNENSDPNIEGAMTFYHSGQSPQLALDVQSELINETGAVDKQTSPATFYVLRNTTMPGILVEMGFVSNAAEAAKLQSDAYRNKIAQGIFNGVVKYFNNK